MQSKQNDNLISVSAADSLIAAHDGDVALLYLYICRSGSTDPEDAARALCRTLGEMEAAREKLGRMGLLEDVPTPGDSVQKIVPPGDEMPQYRAADIVNRCDRVFTDIIQEAQRVLGHSLSSPDLIKLFGIYDFLKLPADVIMMLLNYCAGSSQGRLPSMRYIEKEAFTWANDGILTIEQAEAYIEARRKRGEQSAETMRLLGITGREPSSTEKRYITSWLELGYTPELIAIAGDRTVTNTGALKWGYMNKIIRNWHEKGLFTAEDVETKDRRRSGQPTKKGEPPRDLDELLSKLDKI